MASGIAMAREEHQIAMLVAKIPFAFRIHKCDVGRVTAIIRSTDKAVRKKIELVNMIIMFCHVNELTYTY